MNSMMLSQLSAGRPAGPCMRPLALHCPAPSARLGCPLRLRIRLQNNPWSSYARPARRAVVAVQAQGAASGGAASAAEPPAAPARRHAFLHDFCLCIPYGAIIALCGLAMRLFGGGQTALLIAGAGALEIMLSTLSLKTWRARQPIATLFTALEAGVAGALTWEACKGLQRGVVPIPHAALFLLSAAMTLFLVYNILAGGNPPPKGAAAAETGTVAEA